MMNNTEIKIKRAVQTLLSRREIEVILPPPPTTNPPAHSCSSSRPCSWARLCAMTGVRGWRDEQVQTDEQRRAGEG